MIKYSVVMRISISMVLLIISLLQLLLHVLTSLVGLRELRIWLLSHAHMRLLLLVLVTYADLVVHQLVILLTLSSIDLRLLRTLLLNTMFKVIRSLSVGF